MCHVTMKLSDTFDQNPLVLLTKLGKKTHLMKTLSRLDLESKGQGGKMESQCPGEQKTCLPKKI